MVILGFYAFAQLAIGAGLLLSWRASRTQSFARWLGLAYMVNAAWAVSYWLHAYTPWQALGLLVWALQISASQTLLVLGVRQMRGRADHWSRYVALGVGLAAAMLGLAVLDVRWAVAAGALATLLTGLYMARMLWAGPLEERFAAVMLVLAGALLFLVPITNFVAVDVHQALVSGCRLAAGIALLYASLRRGEAERSRLDAWLKRLSSESHQGIAVALEDGSLVYANTRMLHTLGLAPHTRLPVPVPKGERLPPWRVALYEHIRRMDAEGLPSATWTQRWTGFDNQERNLRITAWHTLWNDADAYQLVVSDETELVQQTERMLHLATHNEHTGLPNRAHASERFAGLVRAAGAAGQRCALLLVNLDRFRAINDALGYERGDEFLRLAGARIQQHLGPGDLLAHQAGDEFIVVHLEDARRTGLPALAGALVRALREPLRIDGIPVHTSASIGVALCPEHGTSFTTLQMHAGIAMRQAKDAGCNTARLFHDGMNVTRLDDLHLLADLNQALGAGQLSLYLQPIVAAQGAAVAGAEVLMRWKHPTRGMVPPSRFIPLAESTGLIIDMGAWLIDQACALLARWQADAATAPLQLSINVSATQFARGDLHEVLGQALRRHGAPPQRLEVEVTESALIEDPEQFVGMLSRLSDMGIELAIDDFGTGYSNLGYLQRFRVNRLKVDQSFVRDVQGSAQARAIVVAVVQMARSLNLQTTAEGIEDAATRDEIVRLGCDHLQGYWFARPMDIAAFEDWLRAYVPPAPAAAAGTAAGADAAPRTIH